MMEKENLEEEDERREAAIASTPSLQPDFKLSRLRQTQLSKFQVLFLNLFTYLFLIFIIGSLISELDLEIF